jgi:O-antigen/teichoic acid export membrane protein
MGMRAVSGEKTVKFVGAATLLTAANLFAAAANYIFQALMGRSLPLAEFGYLNSALSIVTLFGVPLTAASMAVAHHAAKYRSHEDGEAMAGLLRQSKKWLLRLTFVLIAVTILLWVPLGHFFKFPRGSVLLLALLCVPGMMWGQVGQGWCAGLGKFGVLSILLITTACLRLLGGWVGGGIYAQAETGLLVTGIAGMVLAGGLFLRGPQTEDERKNISPWDRKMAIYFCACLSVCLGNFLFLQCDQIVAQRYFEGAELGVYTAASLLGRGIVWGSIPILTVFFTQRSECTRTNGGSLSLLFLYGAALLVGAYLVCLLDVPLTKLLLRRAEPAVVKIVDHFAVTMVPIGILQAMGLFYLATSRIKECLCYGGCAVVYAITLTVVGRQSDLLIFLMQGGSVCSLLLLGMVSLVAWGRRIP